MRALLLLPPLTQLNAPYPSVGFLARFLRANGVEVVVRDLGIRLVERLFSREGLHEVFDEVQARAEAEGLPEPGWVALAHREAHLRVVEPVREFLKGRDATFGPRLLVPGVLPPGPRLDAADPEPFGLAGTGDLARHRASLYLEDLADLVTACVDEDFELARFGHRLAAGPVTFAPLARRLAGTTLLDRWLDEDLDRVLEAAGPVDLVGVSVPFPGTLYGALRMGRRARAAGRFVVLGGGYVSTELREVRDPRLWEAADALVLDDGEGPLLALLEHLGGGADRRHRTLLPDGPRDGPPVRIPFTGLPDWRGLPRDAYLSICDTVSPTHRLWSEGQWHKVALAHGCHWHRCAFCDTGLDCIGRYAPADLASLVDGWEEAVRETGVRGFHLVDEALPPIRLQALALEILERGLAVSFWGNVRFEDGFTPDRCRLMAAAGMVAATGGLEVASDRVLALMDKGVTVAGAVRVASAFRTAGIAVHAYLMYGFPSQTVQETVDAMEVVRQLFQEDVLGSAFWHRFVLTRHSRVFREPERYGIRFSVPPDAFALNDIPHEDPAGADPDRFDLPLARALAAWMRREDLDLPVTAWFDERVPGPTVPPDLVGRHRGPDLPPLGDDARLLWLGGEPLWADDALVLHHGAGVTTVRTREAVRGWLAEVLEAARPGGDPLRLGDARAAFPGSWARFQPTFARVRQAGLVGV